MKQHSTSRQGNDCWIEENWYQLPDSERTVVRVYSVQGWNATKEVSFYDGPTDEMPEEVRDWFRKDTLFG